VKKKRLHVIGGIAALSCFSCVLLYGASRYSVQFPDYLNMICYIGLYVLLPISIVCLFWKKCWLRWHTVLTMGVVVLLSPILYYTGITVQDRNVSHYLVGESEFTDIAGAFLPDPREISLCEHADYLHQKSNSGFEIITLHMFYSSNQYAAVISDLAGTVAESGNQHPGSEDYEVLEDGEFFMEGHSYSYVLIFAEGTYYACAYSQCADCSSVSWIFFSNEELSFMSVQDALFSGQ